MAGLVDYSSSSEEEPATPPLKKRKVSGTAERKDDLPPLPAAFLDQYSSTVRTSAQDDPSLHGGRKRVTPHVQGKWPTHVYLEWYPNVTEVKVLADVVSAVQDSRPKRNDESTIQDEVRKSEDAKVHSLLENDLGVALPLHISLSRPLTLKTEQKDAFLSRLQETISDGNVQVFHIQPKDLAWHLNENSTRWFLVLRLQRSAGGEMVRLLDAFNRIARDFDQPLLYVNKDKRGKVHPASEVGEKFHISVAWALEAPDAKAGSGRRSLVVDWEDDGVPSELSARLNDLSIPFGEVKVRIGQDVHAVSLKAARRRG